MKILNCKIIDGYRIVFGINKPLIDPVSTNKIVIVEIKKEEVYKNINDFKADFSKKNKLAVTAYVKMKNAKKQVDKDQYFAEYKGFIDECKGISESLKPLIPIFKEVQKSLIKSHAIYFEKKAGDEFVDDSFATQVKDKIALGQQNGFVVALDGDNKIEEIINNINKVYYLETERFVETKTISKLGEVVPQDVLTELNFDQIKKNSYWQKYNIISTLSTEQKETDKLLNLEKLDKATIDQKALNVIKGMSEADALTAAGEYYDAELIKLDWLYTNA